MIPTPQIPQVDTTGMTDEEKAKIPSINRLFDTPTDAENELFRQLLTAGPGAIGSPEYNAAAEVVERERRGKPAKPDAR